VVLIKVFFLLILHTFGVGTNTPCNHKVTPRTPRALLKLAMKKLLQLLRKWANELHSLFLLAAICIDKCYSHYLATTWHYVPSNRYTSHDSKSQLSYICCALTLPNIFLSFFHSCICTEYLTQRMIRRG
jgi:hypothetical protein